MPTIGYRLLAASFSLLLLAAADEPPTALRRGINITHWFRFPPSRSPAALRAYLDGKALERLRQAGFTFVRLPAEPDLLAVPGALADAVARIQQHGLAVVVALFANGWHLESDPVDRAKLLETWRSLATVLRRFDPAATFPEVLNEPVFASDPDAWANLQHKVVLTIRGILPVNAIVLTGADWGSVAGLLALRPEPDPNVIYSFHFYNPAELTSLGAYRPGLDTAAMARLPFPVQDTAACNATAATSSDSATIGLMHYYCVQDWDVPKINASIAQVRAWASRHQVPVLAGEFGASQRLNAPARLAWLTAVRAACERQGIGWALWGYDDSMGLALHPLGGAARFDPDVMRALGLVR